MRKGGLIIPVKKNKKNLTNENLILLNLLKNYHYRDKFIAPESVTQKGIKKIVNCDLSVISRILKKNVESGFIYRKKMKIENVRQIKNAYFLSDKGFKLSEDLRKKISEWD